MEFKYYSKHGKIIKKCPGLNEYRYKGELIACGRSISSSDPREKPTKEDWEFCVSLRENASSDGKSEEMSDGVDYCTAPKPLM